LRLHYRFWLFQPFQAKNAQNCNRAPTHDVLSETAAKQRISGFSKKPSTGKLTFLMFSVQTTDNKCVFENSFVYFLLETPDKLLKTSMLSCFAKS
jgi:hypothetical protein